MKPIESHIDRKIRELLCEDQWDGAKKYLLDKSNIFTNQLQKPTGLNRKNNLIQYINHSNKRIRDLDKIKFEWGVFGYDPIKTFDLLLLKEKLGG